MAYRDETAQYIADLEDEIYRLKKLLQQIKMQLSKLIQNI